MIRPQTMPAGALCRRFDAAAVRDGGTPFRVEATEAERDAVAADCGLPGIDALAADFRVMREGPDGLRVTGAVTARVRQICVVSLDEFASDVVEPVNLRFRSGGRGRGTGGRTRRAAARSGRGGRR